MKYTTVRYVLSALLVIAGLYLLIDHGQHLVPYFPFVFLLGCLFMHLFMHGSHGEHGSHNHGEHDQSKQ